MHSALLLLAAAMPQGQGNSRVVINEFQYDDASAADDYEFIELYNRTAAPVDISGWTVDCIEYDTVQMVPITYRTLTIPAGTILQPGGFWVLGSGLVANVNQVIGTSAIFLNELGAFVLRDVGATIEDTAFKETNKGLWMNAPVEGPGLYGNHRSGRVDNLFSSWSRKTDGHDTNNNGRDFINTSATPGATNARNNILPYTDNFDSYSPGFNLPQWAGSFKEVRVTDPTTVGNYNPNPIAASPQGGLCAIAWDDLGGGNSNQLLSAIGDNFTFEAWVYFDATLTPINELDAWSIGAQGTCESFYNLPDPERVTPGSANGNTGVSWTLRRSNVECALYLVDHNDGGSDWTVLGKITITAGSNDGWQRLRLQVRGNFVEGRFGGTYGGRDGTVFASRIAGATGGVYIGYRELLVANGSARPFTFDALSITVGNANVEYYEQALATTVGTPRVTPRGFPLIGSPNFGLDFAGLVPSSLSLLVIGVGRFSPGLPLAPFGGPPNSFLLVPPLIVVNVAATAQGTLPLTMPIANVNGSVGAMLSVQLLNVDLALPFALPIGHTDGVELTIGS
jgi:hypothetical protein